MQVIYAILGPTASGKSAVAMEVAQQIGAEIISLDSMAIYRRMDVGTAKPSWEERKGVPHHLIDICEPWESFSAGRFAQLAYQRIEEIFSRGKQVLLVGGTALYLKALIEGMVEAPPADWQLRQKLMAASSHELYQELVKVDLTAAERISPNDQKRIVRALEVFYLTGKPFSQIQKEKTQPLYQGKTVLVGLWWPREVLYQRIEKRVDKMLEQGLVAETQELLQLSHPLSHTASQAIGYKDVIDFLQGKLPQEQLAPEIKKNTRRFARKQLTWLRRFPVNWIELTEQTSHSEKVHKVLEILQRSLVVLVSLLLIACEQPTEEPLTGVHVIGTRGVAQGMFTKPRAVVYSPLREQLQVVDMTGRIQTFSARGEFISSFRTPEIAAGKPTGLGISPEGNIVVADTHYHRILCYSPKGKLLLQFGEYGTEEDQFIYVTDVAVAANGDYYVTQYGGALGKHDKIQRFDKEGKFIQAWGRGGSDPGEFDRPMSLVIDSKGSIIVADACNHRLQKFSPQGELLAIVGKPGTAANELSYPYGVALNSKDEIFVSEFGNNRIQKFSPEGESLGCFGIAGKYPGMFANPWDLTISRQGTIYIADALNHRVQCLPEQAFSE